MWGKELFSWKGYTTSFTACRSYSNGTITQSSALRHQTHTHTYTVRMDSSSCPQTMNGCRLLNRGTSGKLEESILYISFYICPFSFMLSALYLFPAFTSSFIVCQKLQFCSITSQSSKLKKYCFIFLCQRT